MYIKVDNQNNVLVMYSDGHQPNDDALIFIAGEIPNLHQEGKVAVLKYDSVTNSVYAEYEDIPPGEIELVRIEMARNNAELFETMLMLTGGM